MDWTSDCGTVRLICGDCLEILPTLEAGSVDAVVADPPAGISFMGKQWDTDHGGRNNWIAAFAQIAELVGSRCKPGAHALVWAIPRTSHWTATAWENGGWDVRDRVAHCFGSGFPKSRDVSKAIDKAAGAVRERIRGVRSGVVKECYAQDAWSKEYKDSVLSSEAITPAARQWQGWGTALKPAIEDWWLLRRPLIGTVAANVLKYGTGGINVDGCRVGGEPSPSVQRRESTAKTGTMNSRDLHSTLRARNGEPPFRRDVGQYISPRVGEQLGRWPANLIHDGSEEVVGMFPKTTSGRPCGKRRAAHHWNSNEQGTDVTGYGDSGSAARFFKCCPPDDARRMVYCAKASKADRDEGCEGLALVTHQSGMGGAMPVDDDGNARDRFKAQSRNHHPTVKPTALMRYLCRLVTPSGGIVLDPFMGSGSTGKAAVLEGFRFIGIERDPGYFEIAKRRIQAALAAKAERLPFAEQMTL